jgi:magnesium-transporting ATPase (P-type)
MLIVYYILLGGNDELMIRSANIGVGISGLEG